jgi:hypothetical protein
MWPAAVAGGVDAEFAGTGAEDQPSTARVDVGPAQHIAEEGPCLLGVVGVHEGVDRGDHALIVRLTLCVHWSHNERNRRSAVHAPNSMRS